MESHSLYLINDYVTNEKGLDTLYGTENDGASMAYAFEKLKYEVMWKRNMTKQQLLALVVDAASREYDVSYRCLVFMFSGHGGASQTLFDRYGNPNGQGSGLIYSQEGGALQMDDLINKFKSDQHPHLGDMARLFF